VRGPLTLVRYIRGTLIGKSEQLAARDQLYPIFEWRTKLKSVRIGQDGLYKFEPDDTMTAKLGEDVKFRPIGFEVWDGSTIRQTKAPASPHPAPRPGHPDTQTRSTGSRRGASLCQSGNPGRLNHFPPYVDKCDASILALVRTAMSGP
jgi:hypothetical protein